MGYCVMVVEDQKEIRGIVYKRLENEGYVALCARDGFKALELFGCKTIHLVLLDIIMPGIDGFEVLQGF